MRAGYSKEEVQMMWESPYRFKFDGWKKARKRRKELIEARMQFSGLDSPTVYNWENPIERISAERIYSWKVQAQAHYRNSGNKTIWDILGDSG